MLFCVTYNTQSYHYINSVTLMMEEARRLVYAIIKFLKTQLANGELSEECAEGVEVGIQCLEAAYSIGASEPSLETSCNLLDLFQKYLDKNATQQEATTQNKSLAETLKNEGNFHMNAQNFQEAVACYTKAIKLDPRNAVYYCNRAAATNKLGSYESAIQDCKTALKIDPTYCKAYGRLGLAYESMNQHQEAVTNYKKALELDPENESYKANLKLAEDALASHSASSNATTSTPFHNADLAMIFANPNLLSMASQMLANPSMQHIMNNILTGNAGQERGSGMDVLLEASQQLAQQMESENPTLVEQLRRQMANAAGSNVEESSENRPPKPEPQS